MPSSSKASADKPAPWALVQFRGMGVGGVGEERGERVKEIGRVEEKRDRERERERERKREKGRKTQRERERN